jgi:hypothetical protein
MVLLELCICVWNILFTKCEIVKLYFNSWPCADYLEKKAREMGLEKHFLLTTRTADWLVLELRLQCQLLCADKYHTILNFLTDRTSP